MTRDPQRKAPMKEKEQIHRRVLWDNGRRKLIEEYKKKKMIIIKTSCDYYKPTDRKSEMNYIYFILEHNKRCDDPADLRQSVPKSKSEWNQLNYTLIIALTKTGNVNFVKKTNKINKKIKKLQATRASVTWNIKLWYSIRLVGQITVFLTRWDLNWCQIYHLIEEAKCLGLIWRVDTQTWKEVQVFGESVAYCCPVEREAVALNRPIQAEVKSNIEKKTKNNNNKKRNIF